MSFFSGYDFFVYLIILLIPAVVIGMFEKSLKWYRWVISGFFIWQVYKSTPIQLLYLLAYVIFATYLVKIYLFLRKKYGRNKYIYGHAVLLALLPLIIYKIGAIKGYSLFGFLGISYICFRVIQVIIESYDGVIQEINEYQFIEFLLFFTSLSSGPIDRSRRFNEDDNRVWSRAEYTELLTTGAYKLILGIFYKVACSGVFYYILQTYFEGRYRPMYLIGYAYVYGMYLFFDFAGYSAMAVGTSYILGIRMPDNFNKPFLSIDIKDFWNRWHITLSSWFRDFIFTRFMIDSARKKRFSNRLTGAAVGLIINMVIMGLWHGLEAHYIIYGLYHGCVMAIVEIYQKKSSFYKKNKQKKWYVLFSWFINLNVVMLGFLIFSGYLSETWNVFCRIY
ncbi:MAG: D-alanyl-lipoteichoic acid biosynthesis protein DltB [Roseburia sp.]